MRGAVQGRADSAIDSETVANDGKQEARVRRASMTAIRAGHARWHQPPIVSDTGIAVISFDLSATLHWPSTSRCCELHAEIIWIDPGSLCLPIHTCSAARSNERRNVLPSTATTPRTATVKRSTQAMKQLWNCCASSRANTFPCFLATSKP